MAQTAVREKMGAENGKCEEEGIAEEEAPGGWEWAKPYFCASFFWLFREWR